MYPKAMALAHMPLLSEKVDTVKDLIFIMVVYRDEEFVMSYICSPC